MRAYVDSDILIWHLRGKPKAKEFIRKLWRDTKYELWIGALQRAEITFFLRTGEEDATELLLSLFKTAPVDQQIIDTAALLYRKWNPIHGTDMSDAILAGTVMITGGKVFSLNIKHYPMPDVLVERPW